MTESLVVVCIDSLSCGEDLVEVGGGDVLSADLLAILVELHLVLEAVLAVSAEAGEGWGDHAGVREEDAVEGEAGSLDGVLVHFVLKLIILL